MTKEFTLRRGLAWAAASFSIIDAACGHQPISNEDETVWVLLHGEIYNYTELRRELLRHGHKFTTTSDTEVIVHLYERCGEGCSGCAACFRSRSGTFATASWSSLTIVWARNHRSTSAMALG